ncbi:hypothetical protein F5Y14DRAFT_431784 [Nemania sp. NC0429]|nr:hypothetical protein F5Y14DRAFT_431784 [Nemania sp. NC0429]
MIARGASVGTVCFRCQLRLLRQSTSVRYLASDATAGASTSRDDDAQLRRETAQQEDIAQQNTAHHDTPHQDAAQQDTLQQDIPQQDIIAHEDGPSLNKRSKPIMKKINLRRRHVSRGRVLNEVVARLGPDLLGKPAYAIVMKDGGRLPKKREPPLTTIGDEDEDEDKDKTGAARIKATDLEALVEQYREPPTQLEARINIQSLRPATDKTLPEKEFREIQRLLTNGFLSTQLQDYINWQKRNTSAYTKTDPEEAAEPDFDWITKRTLWEPLRRQPSAVEGTTPQGYVPDTTLPKGRLAIRLMRECWGLSILELDALLGETLVKLKPDAFVLLMRGTQRFMNTLSKVWLEPGEKIEAFRHQTTLRLVTTKAKTDTLLADLDRTLRSITKTSFPLHLVTSEPPDDAILEELGRITNTHLRKSPNQERLHVTWIEVRARNGQGHSTLEDMAHIVFRLLLTASTHSRATSVLIPPKTSPMAAEEERPGRLLVDATSKDQLSWRDKLAQWARYVYPITSKESPVKLKLPTMQWELPFEVVETRLLRPQFSADTSSFALPSEAVEAEAKGLGDSFDLSPPVESPSSQLPPRPVQWSRDLRTSTVAYFGQILHPYRPSQPAPSLSDLQSSTDRRVFAPTAPHPLHLARFEPLNDADWSTTPPLITTRSTLVLRFWPSPSSNPTTKPPAFRPKKPSSRSADTPGAPVLELRLAVSGLEIRGVESLRAVSRTHHADVMLPSSLVDVRFTQTQYETLRARDPDGLASWQPVADFLRDARLDLAQGRLEMPPRQRFPVPRRLFSEPPSATATAAADEPDDQDVSVLYEFVGSEFHRATAVPHEGHQLTYTSIEAGQGGGRRVEVTLEPLRPASPTTATASSADLADDGRLQKDFLACCSRFVANRSLWSGISIPKRNSWH